MPLTKCGIMMMSTDPDDIWLNEHCEFGDEESGEILDELIEHYHGNEEGLCKFMTCMTENVQTNELAQFKLFYNSIVANTVDEWKQHFFIWLLERRQKEINKVEAKLDAHVFPDEHSYYQSMIVDMLNPPKKAIKSCLSRFVEYTESTKL